MQKVQQLLKSWQMSKGDLAEISWDQGVILHVITVPFGRIKNNHAVQVAERAGRHHR